MSLSEERDTSRDASFQAEDTEVISLTVQHHGKPVEFRLPQSATLEDLSNEVVIVLEVPTSNQKFMIPPKPGMVRPPFKPEHRDIPLSALAGQKITLLGSTVSEISSLNTTIKTSQMQASRHRTTNGPIKPATPARHRDWKRNQEDVTYTFLQLRPLPYLPGPERSLRFLERLRDDAGIRATMRRHKWSVPLLTEMNPAEHTTQESRTLGLNRNKGEVIELRLRTDAYDGYRDYKTIRRTLCHELTHNVFSEHDRHFWDLCHEIEREVERDDWKHGGRTVGQEEYYEPEQRHDEDVFDHAGWIGGEYVLGGGSTEDRAGTSSSLSAQTTRGEPLNRREILARAVEERLKKQREAQEDEKLEPPPK